MIPLKLMFWNVRGATDLAPLSAIVKTHAPEVVVLAESARSEVEVLSALNESGPITYHLTTNHSDRLQFFTSFSGARFEPMHDEPGVAVRRIDSVLGEQLLLVAVHLSSKLRLDEAEQAMLATRLGRTVRSMEERVGHTRTIVIGDFNMNPFEHGVVGSEGLHAVSTRTVAMRGARTVLGEERPLFYNPMWSFFGDDSPGPPGTYYYAGSGPISYFWHTFDQVLLRPELASAYEPGDVTILDAAGETPLRGAYGVPNRTLSDHLPILATIRVQESIDGNT